MAATAVSSFFTVAGKIAPLEKVKTLVCSAYDTLKAINNLPEDAESLREDYKEIKENVEYLDSAFQAVRCLMLEGVVHIFQGRLDKIATTVEKQIEEMSKTPESVWAKLEFKNTIEKFKKETEDINNKILYLSEWVDRRYQQQPLQPSHSVQDSFRAFYCRNDNDEDIVLDYDTKDQSGAYATYEGELLNKIDTSEATVAAVAAGISGVGKTCALKGLSSRDEVRKNFTGGVYFMSLGQNATKRKLVNELQQVVTKSRGLNHALSMHSLTLENAVSVAREWFRDHCCLFIVDDVWPSNLPGNSLETLQDLIDDGSKSRIAYSTMDRTSFRHSDYVFFETRGTRAACNMLLKAAGNPAKPNRNSPEVRTILYFCRGLPFSLVLAGRYMYQSTRAYNGDPISLWETYAKELQSSSSNDTDQLIEKSILKIKSPTSDSVKTSLHALQALSVLRKKDWAPVPFLQKLWSMDESHVADIVSLFDRYGIAKLEIRDVNKRHVKGLTIHDLMHDYCIRKAGNEQWFEHMLDAYKSECSSPRKEPVSYLIKALIQTFLRRPEQSCWPAGLEDDGYIFANLSRFLLHAKQDDILRDTLTNVHWVVKMMDSQYSLQYEQDIADLETHLDVHSSGGDSQNPHHTRPQSIVARQLKTLNKIVRMSVHQCQDSKQQKWFLLYSRIQSAEIRDSWAARALLTIRASCPRPCLLPILPCVKGASDPFLDRVEVRGRIQHVQVIRETTYVAFLSFQRWRAVSVMKFRHGLKPETLSLPFNDEKGIDPCGLLECAFISTDGAYATSRCTRGCLRIWDLTSKEVKKVLLGHNGGSGYIRPVDIPNSMFHSGVTMSKDNRRVVSRSRNENTSVWEVDSGQKIQLPAAADEWTVGVSISYNGERVVCASRAGIVRIWCLRAHPLCVATISCTTTFPRSVSMSSDGMKVALGLDDGSVGIWDESYNKHEILSIGRQQAPVHCVAISDDGRRMISGCHGQDVQVWDVESRMNACVPLEGHQKYVAHVCINEDGKRVVSSTLDGDVRVWEIDSENQSNHSLWKHHERIRDARFNKDGTRVLLWTGQSLQLWDTESREQIGRSIPQEYNSRINLFPSGNLEVVLLAGKSSERSPPVEDASLWNVLSGEQICSPRGLQELLMGWRHLSLSWDGTKVISMTSGNIVRVFEVKEGTTITQQYRHRTEAKAEFARKIGHAKHLTTSSSRQPVVRLREHPEANFYKLFSSVGEKTALAVFDSPIRAMHVSDDHKIVNVILSGSIIASLELVQ